MAELIIYANSCGLSVKVSEWNRLLETQKKYVALGLSKTLNSTHLINCGTDLYIIKNGAPTQNQEDYRVLGVYWENRGGRWGGRFHDAKLFPNFNPEKDLGWDVYHFESDA